MVAGGRDVINGGNNGNYRLVDGYGQKWEDRCFVVIIAKLLF